MYINYYLIIKIIMNYVLIIILSISFGCTILYLINKYELRNKYIALQDLLSLTTQDVDEYMNTFNTQWAESTHGLDIIKQYVSSPKDYINKLPLKASDTVGSKTAIIYKILNMMCSLGNVKKMYIPPTIDKTKSLKENQLLWEREIADYMNVSGNNKVLDVGCGMGLVANYISDITLAEVHGLNVEESGIEYAQKLAVSKGRDKSLFTKWDYNQFPWPYKDNFFDAIYEIQAFTFMREPDKFFKELYRVLKPGGRIVINETVFNEDFDVDNDEHLRLFIKLRPCIVGGNIWYYKYWEDEIKKAGFDLKLTKFPPSALSNIKNEDTHFAHIEMIIKAVNYIGLIPNHVCRLLRRFRTGGDSMIRLEEIGGYRHNFLLVMEKPIGIDNGSSKKSESIELEKSAS